MPGDGSFAGAKVALLQGGAVLAYLRDDFDHLPWPNHWDLPGGGREGDERPETCVLRELQEEFGLVLPEERLLWRREFPSVMHPGLTGWFYAGRISAAEIAAIRFGDEGQFWQMMPVAEFLGHRSAVPFLQDRLRIALAEGLAG